MLSRALPGTIPARNFWPSRWRCSSHYRHVADPFPVFQMGFRKGIHAGSFNGTDFALGNDVQWTATETTVPKEEEKPTKGRDLSNYPTRQFTIKSKRPETATKSQILEATFRVRTHLPYTRDQCLVILATPSFAKWLEDDVYFMPNFLRQILHQGERFPKWHIDVLAAVVDNISPSPGWINSDNNRPPAEGFSVLQGKTDEILPGLLDRKDAQMEELDSSAKSSLTFFSDGGTSEGVRDLRVTLPLANTLFTNGRHSTLFVSRWKCKKSNWIKITSFEKFSQAVKITLPAIRLPPSIVESQRAIPLTIPRRIVSGLGNIIRQLDVGDKEPGPASRELEINVPAYQQTARNKGVLHMPDAMQRTIPVWALVVPDHLAQEFISSSPTELVFNKEFIRAASNYLYNTQRPRALSGEPLTYWISRGAVLCRVLSGGGGWGAKQGLLSLDPQITYNDDTEVDLDFALNESVEEQQTSALGNLAKPGSYIQFFTRNFTLQPIHKKAAFVHTGLLHFQPESWPWSTVFGTVPSTVDHPTSRIVLDNQGEAGKIDLLRGHFGAMSESGLFLHFKPSTSTSSTLPTNQLDMLTVSTKMDLPYSYVVHESKPLEFPGIKRMPTREVPNLVIRIPSTRKDEREEPKLSNPTIKKTWTA